MSWNIHIAPLPDKGPECEICGAGVFHLLPSAPWERSSGQDGKGFALTLNDTTITVSFGQKHWITQSPFLIIYFPILCPIYLFFKNHISFHLCLQAHIFAISKSILWKWLELIERIVFLRRLISFALFYSRAHSRCWSIQMSIAPSSYLLMERIVRF